MSATTKRPHVYVGLAGETAPGRVIKSGLYRMSDDDGEWKLVTRGLPEAPAVRCIAVHPLKPHVVYVGTQSGPYRSTDNGDHWEKVDVPDHGKPVWSLMFHPRDPDVMFAGYEDCEIYRSANGGETWKQLPVSVRFPEVTVGPGSNPAKRLLTLAGVASDPSVLYGAIEVGGVIRSRDGGEHWENLSHGQYVNDDTVDTHAVLPSSAALGTVFSVARAGLFRSKDWGDHWQKVDIEPLNAKGQTYCRCIREAPNDPRTIWVSAGPNFQSELGVLFRSRDAGSSWERVDMGLQPKSTMFGLTLDDHEPGRMYCATRGGEVFGSRDHGSTWKAYPLPAEATQAYALACA